jgi:predicted GNAT family N-acyltransferase
MLDGPKKHLLDWARIYIIRNTCCYCYVKCSSLNELQVHLRNTTEHEVYFCCGRLFNSQSAFDQHQRLGGLCKANSISRSSTVLNNSSTTTTNASTNTNTNPSTNTTTNSSPLAVPLPHNGLRDLRVSISNIAAEGPASGNAATIYTSIRNRKCYTCIRSFPSLSALDNHLRNCAHDVFACCGRLFINHQAIAEHQTNSQCIIQRAIDDKSTISSSSSSYGVIPASKSSSGQFSRKLNIQLEASTSLETLYKVLGDISLYRAISSMDCFYCNRRFNATADLMAHLVNTSSHEVYQCCTILFKDMNSLEKHKRIHHHHQ